MNTFTDREYKLLKAALDKEERLYDGIGNYELVQTIKDTKKKLKKMQCNIQVSENNINKYRRINDGWFSYFINIKTGEQKFTLDAGDVEVII